MNSAAAQVTVIAWYRHFSATYPVSPTLHISLILCLIPSPALTYLWILSMADPDPS